MPLWQTLDGMPPGLMLPVHPGDWRAHHIAALRYGTSKGDFTPEYVRQDIEVEITVGRQFLEHLYELLGIDHPGPISSRIPPPPAAGIEAG